jgi:transposase
MFPNERFRRAYLLTLDEYDGIAAQLSELNTIVHELLVAEPYVKRVTLLRTIPGIGPLIALSLVLEVEDFARFRNHGEFASYLGLVPSEHSSGERIRRGHLTGMGHTYLRSLLIQAAWVAVRKDPELRRVFERLAVGGKQRAIVAVARKLAHRIRTVVIEQRPYQIR